MDKTTLLKEMENSHREALELLENLPDKAFSLPIEGDWNLKDILAHLTMWEAQLVTLLWQASRGGRPSTVHFSGRSTEAINAEWYAQNKERPLALVWNDFVRIRDQTLRRVRAFSEKDLQNPRRYRWLGGRPLWQWVAEATFEHEREHLEPIRSWAEGYPNA